jgi:hypothetical protein
MAFHDKCACGKTKQRRSKTCGECRLAERVAASSVFGGTDSFDSAGNSAVLTKTTSESVRTLADLVRVCAIDTAEWEIERWIANVWGDNFQVKAWLKRKVALIAAKSEIADIIAEAKTRIPARVSVKRGPEGPHMLEIAIPDLHVGKLAWGQETGAADYDTKIAKEVFEQALEALIARTGHYPFERVVFPIGQDLLHSDTMGGTTTKGTRLDMDSRYQKSFTVARQLMTWGIDRLRQIAPVDAYIIPGNHDQLGAFTLGAALECQFHSTSGVTINNAPTSRKYVQYGQNMLLLTHGDKGKKENYPLLMATEQPEMFGATTHREVHTGHLHQTRVQEFHGVKVRISPALCSTDAWHAENMFTGQARGAEAYVWHKTEGLVNISLYTVPKQKAA